jgi:coenzyme F420-0:L-glutamate ligase/coenzyme F420-1:gamma-L-glutamate ligase
VAGVIQIEPLTGLPEILPGTDLSKCLAAAIGQRPGIAVVTQKIVSKAEGCFVDLASISPGARAIELSEITGKCPRFVEVVLAEAVAVVRAAPHVLIVRHRSGHVMANAGVDRSNLGNRAGDWVLLLPRDADESAARLCAALNRPVVISDSFGRPWRMGVTAVAIGAAGLPALDDRRGRLDRDGRCLEVTQIALADAIAAAANLAMGEGAEGIPAALITGLVADSPPSPAAALVRPPEQDLFR